MPTDARGVTRDDRCDAGAHEFSPIVATVAVAADPILVDPIAPATGVAPPQTLTVDVVYQVDLADQPNQRLEVVLEGYSGRITTPNPTARITGATVTFDVAPTATEIVQQFEIELAPDRTGPITATATLDVLGDTPSGQLPVAETTFDVVFDPNIDLTHTEVGGVVSRCAAPLPFDFSVTPTGASRLGRDFAMLLRPVGEATIRGGGGTVVASGPDMRWVPERLDTEGEDAGVRVTVDPSAYAPGAQIIPQARGTR